MPTWVTILLSVVFSGVTSTGISLFENYKIERKQWLKNKRLEEWRELIVAVESAVSNALITHGDASSNRATNGFPPNNTSSEAYNKTNQEIGQVYSLLRTRIFTRSLVQREKLVGHWIEFRSAYWDPDHAKLREKFGIFQTALEKVVEVDMKSNPV